MLDRAAAEAKGRMSEEAPKGKGRLASNITITSPSELVRVIEPTARNIRPGNKYAHPIEMGWGTVGAFPNVFSISQYYGVDMKLAFAIAAGIARKTYRPNPFVKRTYDWAQNQIMKHAGSFMRGITAHYGKG